MTEKEYNYISAIADCGNITKAAEKLFIAQPSLTQSLHNIEEDYGAKFFYRNHDGVRLTEAGEAYIAAAKQALCVYEQMKKEIQGNGKEQYGRITIGLEGFLAGGILGDLIEQYTYRYPNINLKIVESPISQLQKMLLEGKLDMILIHYPFISDTLNFVPLMDDELVLAVSIKNQECRKSLETTGQLPLATAVFLEQQKFLMMTSEQQIRSAAENICRTAGIEPHICYTSTSMVTVLDLITRGFGVSILPSSICRRYETMYPMFQLRFPKEWNTEWQLSAAYPSDQVMPEFGREVIGVLRKMAGGIE